MSFAARAFRDEACLYRLLSRAIKCPRIFSLLNEIACDLERKAEAMEKAAGLQIAADDTHRKR